MGPKEHWPFLLQCVLPGKAWEIFVQLSVEQASDYNLIKEVILQGYELAPKVYHQKFRMYSKTDKQTFVAFAREKEQLFDRWCNSERVNKNFDKLKQLLLIEEFKQCIHVDIRTFINEEKTETLADAALLPDNYSLTHRVSFSNKPNCIFSQTFQSLKMLLHRAKINEPKRKPI